MFNLRSKLEKTRAGFSLPLKKLFSRAAALEEADVEAIEEILIGADIGVEAAERIIDRLKALNDPGDYRRILKEELIALLEESGGGAPPRHDAPRAIITVGVNGVGKTTSVAKLANHLKKKGDKVLLAACDTFRAAAASQLAIWAERIDVQVVSHAAGGDPAAVAYDGCEAAKARGMDYLILDTAGRLHTKVNLMEELKKIKRVCEKNLSPGAVEIMLVIDATLGQNSLHQARRFTENLDADGIILTKLDSTAKGGIVVAIKQSLGIPVLYVGVGESVDDFLEFSPVDFVEAVLA
jgi:fused signal recognition particle receptor